MIWDWLRKSRRSNALDDVENFLGVAPLDRFNAASQVLGNFMDGNDQMRRLLSNIVYFCGEKIAEKTGFEKFMEVIDCGNSQVIESAARLAEDAARQLHTTIDPKLSMTSDGYACISIMFDGKNQKFEGDNSKREITEMIAHLYAAIEIEHAQR